MKSFDQIMSDLKKSQYASVYLLDGEEPYYIDKLLHYFEEHILLPEERDFNLITLYGKDAEWEDVVNAARRFPMFAERMVVLLKEAGQMKNFGGLESYVENPSPTTILVLEHRFKKMDGRSKLAKLIPKKGVYFTSEKLREDQVSSWVVEFGRQQHIEIGAQEAEMLSVYLGNDLQKIANELEKIKINEQGLSQLTIGHIEKYIGISREYNIFDLPDALFRGDKNKLARMVSYFHANPKSAPMALVIGTYYGYLSKVFLCYYVKPDFQNDRKLGLWTHHRKASGKFSLSHVHRAISVLEEFSHKSVGVGSVHHEGALLKEMIGKLNVILFPA